MTVEHALRMVGLPPLGKGYLRVKKAIELVLEDETLLEARVKGVYWEAGTQCGCRWTAVERNIRLASQRAWKVNPKLLEEMAGYKLLRPPTAGEFLEIMNYYIRTANAAQAAQAAQQE